MQVSICENSSCWSTVCVPVLLCSLLQQPWTRNHQPVDFQMPGWPNPCAKWTAAGFSSLGRCVTALVSCWGGCVVSWLTGVSSGVEQSCGSGRGVRKLLFSWSDDFNLCSRSKISDHLIQVTFIEATLTTSSAACNGMTDFHHCLWQDAICPEVLHERRLFW